MYVDRVQYGFALFFITMKYKRIFKTDTQQPAGHTTIRGLKLAIRQGKLKEGNFICHTHCGNIHHWEIKQSGTHTCAGSTGSKGKIGKGVTVTNYAAKLVKVITA